MPTSRKLFTTTHNQQPRPGMPTSDEERQQFRLEPTDEDIQATWNTIRTHESAIESVEDQIRGLSAEIRELRYVQARHRAVIARCRGRITLARRLPQELLVKIFMHCVEDGGTRTPMVVSQVCSAWRRAAHAPKVWSHVYVPCDDANVVERTKFWLSMAQGADLHVTVAATWRFPRRTILDVMALLVDRSAQWRSLRLETETFRHADVILAQCQNPMPELRRIDIETPALDSDEGISDLTRLPAVFSATSAPRLLVLNYVSLVIPAVPIFPTHLTDLTVEVVGSPEHRPLSAEFILAGLEHLSELRTLALTMPLYNDAPFVAPDDPARGITLPNLTALTLYGPTDLNGLLAHMHTPALRTLCLRSRDEAGPPRAHPLGPSLTHFLEQSAPPLALLELHDISLDPETFAACFARLPALRELRLHEAAITDATVRLLHGDEGGGGSGGLCPRLSRLVLRWCSLLHGRALVDLVRSRQRVADGDMDMPGAMPAFADPIEEVAVINCCFVLEDDVLDLARMTTCRIVRDATDYCADPTCCENGKYRLRLRLKHALELSDRRASGVRLVL